MLSLPIAGWVTVTINNTVLGAASYLDDVPSIVLDAFISCLTDMATTDLPTHLSITLDAEGYQFGCLVWNRTLYLVNNAKNEPPYLNMTEVPVDDLADYPPDNLGKYLVTLAHEVYNDIHDHLDDWCHYNPDAFDSEERQEKYRHLYQGKLYQLRALITALENGDMFVPVIVM
ncbi:hypothetical protein ACKX2D_05390 [Lachnospiraceae bacterium YH-ros2226]